LFCFVFCFFKEISLALWIAIHQTGLEKAFSYQKQIHQLKEFLEDKTGAYSPPPCPSTGSRVLAQ